MKHKILILDDDMDRFTLFNKLIGSEYDSVYTAENFLSEAQRGAIVAETLLLDHDLGANMNGTKLARTLRDEKVQMPTVKRILIHSNNTTGGTEMLFTLREAYPDMVIKLLPTSSLTDVWNDFGRDKNATRDFINNIS